MQPKEKMMPLIAIDRSRCKKDGICMAECPFNLIVANPEDGFPEMRPAGSRLCILCGHCLAVCPQEALSFSGQGTEPCQALGHGSLPSLKKTGELLKGRRSIRNYLEDPVPRELLQQLLDICRWAPSAKNRQPVHWLVVENPAEVRRLAGLAVDWLREAGNYPGIVAAWEQGQDMVLRGAPHLVIAHSPDHGLKPETDCTIAMTFFDLAAASAGLGACWAGIFMAAAQTHPPLQEALALPEGHLAYGAMMLGYPKFPYLRIPPRRKLKVTWRS
jgi:nitroreductase/NAD-dependent dihydropyrimidine dehydrogenase PreA subunit